MKKFKNYYYCVVVCLERVSSKAKHTNGCSEQKLFRPDIASAGRSARKHRQFSRLPYYGVMVPPLGSGSFHVPSVPRGLLLPGLDTHEVRDEERPNAFPPGSDVSREYCSHAF